MLNHWPEPLRYNKNIVQVISNIQENDIFEVSPSTVSFGTISSEKDFDSTAKEEVLGFIDGGSRTRSTAWFEKERKQISSSVVFSDLFVFSIFKMKMHHPLFVHFVLFITFIVNRQKPNKEVSSTIYIHT